MVAKFSRSRSLKTTGQMTIWEIYYWSMAPKSFDAYLIAAEICLELAIVISISFNRASYTGKSINLTSRYGISSKISELHHDGKLYTLFSLSQVNRKNALPQPSTASPCYSILRVLEKFKTLLHGKPYLAIK